MSNILDRDNQHLLLQRPQNKGNSFIAHVNTVASNIQSIIQSNEYFNADVIEILREVTKLNLYEAVADLRKGNYLGNRKLDINLALNMQGINQDLIENDPDTAKAIWVDNHKVVLYDSATITFTDGEIVEMEFEFDGFPTTVSTHGDLLIQFSQHAAFLAKLDNTLISGFAAPVVGEIARCYDVIGSNSNIERVTLHAISGEYKEQHPTYYWAKTTSAFQTLSMRAGDIIKLGNDIDKIILLASRINEVLDIQSRLPQLIDTYTEDVPNGDITIYNSLDILIELYDHLQKFIDIYGQLTKLVAIHEVLGKLTDLHTVIPELSALYTHLNGLITLYTNWNKLNTIHSKIGNLDIIFNNITDLANIATNLATILQSPNHALTASQKAAEALASANTATEKANQIIGLTAEAITGASGVPASAVYNPVNGKLSFVIPKGDKGDRGEPFQVNAMGDIANISLYDNRPKGFSFLALDEGNIYFKESNEEGDWSVGVSFGKGDKGDKGDVGRGILSATKIGSTNNVDHYRITFTDNSVFNYDVINGPLDDSVTTLYAAWSGSKVNTALGNKLDISQNLGDLNSSYTARSNLGLGTAAILNFGTGSDDLPKNSNLGNAAYENVVNILGTSSTSPISQGAVKTAIDGKTSEAFILKSEDFTAIKDGRYALLPEIVMTLPTSPSVGDTITFKAAGSLEDVLEDLPMIDANGNKVHGVEEDDIAVNGLGEVSLTWVGNDKGGWI